MPRPGDSWRPWVISEPETGAPDRPDQDTSGDRRPWWLALSAAHLAALLTVRWIGLPFDTTTLDDYWQVLDPQLLREDLLHSVWLLHSQPPLFNLLLGTAFKVSGDAAPLLLLCLWWLLGCALLLCTFELLRRIGIAARAAALISLAFSLRPSNLLIENWLTYDLPVAVLVTWLALVAHDVARGRARREHLLLWLIATLCALRSLFHPLLFLLAATWVFRRRSGQAPARRLGPAVIPGALLGILLVKNLLLFGTPGLSSWFGMNVARVATASISGVELGRLHRDGQLRVAHIAPFAPVRAYAEVTAADGWAGPEPSHPALDDELKSNGSTNYNHRAYLTISRDYGRDVLWLATHRPARYVESVAKAWYAYHQPPSRLAHIDGSSTVLASWDEVWQRLIWLRFDLGLNYRGEARPVFVTLALAIPAAFLCALLIALRSPASPRRALLWWTLATVAYVALVGNTFEVWENQRFRFVTDPLLLTFACLAGAELRQRFRRSRAAGTSR